MQINLITVGNRMPSWVEQGYDEYAKRMPRDPAFSLKHGIKSRGICRNFYLDLIKDSHAETLLICFKHKKDLIFRKKLNSKRFKIT